MTYEDTPILSSAVLAELRESTGDDEEFVRELVEAYIGEGAGYLEAMTAAAAAGDAAAMVRPAHTMKSSSATMGAMRLSVICRGLEEAGRAGDVEGMSSAVASAQAVWAETLEAMTAAGLTG